MVALTTFLLAQAALHWPLVPHPLFVVAGIDANGANPLIHAKIGDKPGTTAIGKPKTFAHGAAANLPLPPGTAPWRTLQIVFTSTVDGTLATLGSVDLEVRKGWLLLSKAGTLIRLAQVANGDVCDVQLVRNFGALIAYINGSAVGKSMTAPGVLMPVEVGIDPWKGAVIGIAGYDRELSVDELYANARAARDMAKALFADTLKATVEGEMTAFTPVPDVERIRPYRSALICEEYKVIRLVSGRMSALKPGMKIRVLRYGVRSGEKTALKNAKVGDRAQMLIQSFDSDEKFGREFRVDDLDPDITIPMFVDVTPEN